MKPSDCTCRPRFVGDTEVHDDACALVQAELFENAKADAEAVYAAIQDGSLPRQECDPDEIPF